MSEFLNRFLVVFAIIGLTACSSSQVEDETELGEDSEFAEDADTDAVPEDESEDLADDGEGEDDWNDEGDDEGWDDEAEGGAVADGDAGGEGEFAAADDTSFDSGAESGGFGDAAPEGGLVDYTVKSGDTLMKIAFETYGDLYAWRKIMENNGSIGDPNNVPPGTILRVPPAVQMSNSGERYLIKWGDTLGTISYDIYGQQKKWRRLWDNNRKLIHDPNKIYAGFYLYYLFTDQDAAEKQQLGMSGDTSPRQPAAAAAEAAPAADAGSDWGTNQ